VLRVVRTGVLGLAVNGVDAHTPHERSDMATANVEALSVQLVAQHPRTHEGKVHVQFVDGVHQLEVNVVDGFGFVVHHASTETQQFGLACDG
jgi:hypothetical protein